MTKLLEETIPKCSGEMNSESEFVKCFLSLDKLSARVEVPLDFNVVECCELNGR